MSWSKLGLAIKALVAVHSLRSNYKEAREAGAAVPDSMLFAVKTTAKGLLVAEAKQKLLDKAGDRG